MFTFHCSDKIARKPNLKEELLVCRSVVMWLCRPWWRKVRNRLKLCLPRCERPVGVRGRECTKWNALVNGFTWPTSSPQTLLCTATPSSSVVTSWEQCLCHERLGVKIQILHVMWNVRSNCEPRVMRMENYSSNNYTFKDPTVWRTALGHV